MSVRAAGIVAVAVAALLPSAAAAAPALTVRATVSPPTVSFGDPFTYVAEARASTGSLEVIADTGAFTALAPAVVRREDRAGQAVVRVTQRLACLGVACVPRDGARRVALPPARAVVRTRSGTRVAGATASPVAVEVEPRVPAKVVASRRDGYRRETDLPELTPTVSPGLVAALGAVAAVALGVLALLLFALELRARRARARSALSADEVTRAIRLVRESAARPAADRRRAAGLLARVSAGRSAEPIADDAALVAWSRREPAPADAEELAARADTMSTAGTGAA